MLFSGHDTVQHRHPAANIQMYINQIHEAQNGTGIHPVHIHDGGWTVSDVVAVGDQMEKMS